MQPYLLLLERFTLFWAGSELPGERAPDSALHRSAAGGEGPGDEGGAVFPILASQGRKGNGCRGNSGSVGGTCSEPRVLPKR